MIHYKVHTTSFPQGFLYVSGSRASKDLLQSSPEPGAFAASQPPDHEIRFSGPESPLLLNF